MKVANVKVSVPMRGADMPRDILPPPGAPGSAKATVTLQLECEEMRFEAVVKAKSYRDALAKADGAPHGAMVILQGKLGADNKILDAGFTVQPIVPKEAAAPVS